MKSRSGWIFLRCSPEPSENGCLVHSLPEHSSTAQGRPERVGRSVHSGCPARSCKLHGIPAAHCQMSRTTYKSAQTWSVQEASTPFWSKPSQSTLYGGKVNMLKTALKSGSKVTPAAEAYLLHKGLTTSEVEKVVLLRDLIIKQAMASQRYHH